MSYLPDQKQNWEELEIDLLLKGIYHRYGFDFSEFDRGQVKEKIRVLLALHAIPSISALQDRVLHDPLMGEALLCELNVRDASLLDDPEYINQLRLVAIPWLRSHPAPKIWIPNCVSNEQVCALIILLEEEDIDGRTQIFATGSNEKLLQNASSGGIDRMRLEQCLGNHQLGGIESLSRYFDIDGDRLIMLPHLRNRVTWALFNLQTDASFNEFQLIVCRQVLGYFGATLQRRVLHLFRDSLSMFGIVSIDDPKEMERPPFCSWFKSISAQGNLYKRIA